jgi:transcriptional regulator with XRE-family HTH domain
MLLPMVTRERLRDRGNRRARAILGELGRELRDARRALGLSQASVARAAGVSPSWLSRVERQEAAEVSLRLLTVLGAVVGLDLTARVFAGGAPLRDAGHRRVLKRFRSLLPASAPWATEVPFPRAGDQRAWDAVTRLWDVRIGTEVETRPTDLQAMERRVMLKARDGGVDRVVLVLADTRRNRHLMREVGEALRGSFPLQGDAALAALRSSNDPGCNLLVLV